MLSYVNSRATDDSPGFYPHACTRYHRFTVTHPGNFTFDTCASMFALGLQLYKRTDNVSESEPRTPKGGKINPQMVAHFLRFVSSTTRTPRVGPPYEW